MNLEPISNYIAANTDLEQGTTLFDYVMPSGIKSGVLLISEPSLNQVDQEIKGVVRGRFQAVVRGKSFTEGKTRAKELFDLLNLLEMDLTEYTVTYCRPIAEPFPFARSEGANVEFSVNFEIRYRYPD